MKCEKYKKILFEAVCLSLVVKSSSRYYHCYKVEGLAWDGDGTRNLAGAGPPAGFLFRRPAGPSVRVLRAADFTVRPGGWWIVSGLSGSHDSVGSQ